MCDFYRKYVPNFAQIATPLTTLTRNSVDFTWTDKCQQAFEALKEKLMNAPILVQADITKPFAVTTDASDTHVGGVLSQAKPDGSDRAIGYF